MQNLCQVQKLLSYQSFAICTSKNKHIHECECKSNKWFKKTGSGKENPCLRSLRTNYCTSLEHQLCIRYVAKLHTDINYTDTHNKSFILDNTGAFTMPCKCHSRWSRVFPGSSTSWHDHRRSPPPSPLEHVVWPDWQVHLHERHGKSGKGLY